MSERQTTTPALTDQPQADKSCGCGPDCSCGPDCACGPNGTCNPACTCGD